MLIHGYPPNFSQEDKECSVVENESTKNDLDDITRDKAKGKKVISFYFLFYIFYFRAKLWLKQ